MTKWEEQFTSFLRARGLTYTPERKNILEEIFSTHDHFDIESIHDRLREKGARISVATIYRMIPLLIESGMIRPATVRRGRPTYEHLFGHRPHHHLICARCGKVVEFRQDAVERLLDRVCQRNGFSPFDYRIGVRGVCAGCRKGEE